MQVSIVSHLGARTLITSSAELGSINVAIRNATDRPVIQFGFFRDDFQLIAEPLVPMGEAKRRHHLYRVIKLGFQSLRKKMLAYGFTLSDVLYVHSLVLVNMNRRVTVRNWSDPDEVFFLLPDWDKTESGRTKKSLYDYYISLNGALSHRYEKKMTIRLLCLMSGVTRPEVLVSTLCDSFLWNEMLKELGRIDS